MFVFILLADQKTMSAIGSDSLEDHVTLSRQDIMNRTDIFNIISQLGLRKERLDSDDVTSIDLLLARYETQEFTPFFCFYFEGDTFTLGKHNTFL